MVQHHKDQLGNRLYHSALDGTAYPTVARHPGVHPAQHQKIIDELLAHEADSAPVLLESLCGGFLSNSSQGDMQPPTSDIFEQWSELDIKSPPGRPPMNQPRCRKVKQQPTAEVHTNASSIMEAQRWLNHRFSNLRVEDVHKDGIVIFSTTRLEAPCGFEEVWQVVESAQQMQAYISKDRKMPLFNVGAILLIGDPQSDAQVELLCEMSRILNQSAGDNSPPIFWLQHKLAPNGSAKATSSQTLNGVCVNTMTMNSGVDDIIPGEPVGHELALNVRIRINKQVHLSEKVNRAINKKQEMHAKAEERHKFLTETIKHVLWDYLRLRLQTDIPPVDPEALPGLPPVIDGYQLSAEPLGRGRFGKVFPLMIPGQGLSGKVVKCIKKEQISQLMGLKSIKNQIKILNMLSQGHAHENIVCLEAVYHTSTHILLRMEDCGSMNLFHRLKLRDKAVENWSLGLAKALTLFSQAIQAIAHLHSVQVVHRDIKPENICIQETLEGITLTVIDFDCALLAQGGFRSSHAAGTFPFIAPEVFAEDSYDPYPLDIWSLGVTFCEMGCGVRVIGDKLKMSSPPRGVKDESNQDVSRERAKDLMQQVADYFREEDAVAKVLETSLRAELFPVAEPLRFMLNRMIRTQVELRCSAPQVLMLSQTLQQAT